MFLLMCNNTLLKDGIKLSEGMFFVFLNFLCFRYLDNEGQLSSQFLDMVPIPDGTADTIVEAVRDVVVKKSIPVNHLYGLGTDGIMTGS